MNEEKQSATQVDNIISPGATEYGVEFICAILKRRGIDIAIDEIRSMYNRSIKAITSEGWYHGGAIKRSAVYSILSKLTPGWCNE